MRGKGHPSVVTRPGPPSPCPTAVHSGWCRGGAGAPITVGAPGWVLLCREEVIAAPGQARADNGGEEGTGVLWGAGGGRHRWPLPGQGRVLPVTPAQPSPITTVQPTQGCCWPGIQPVISSGSPPGALILRIPARGSGASQRQRLKRECLPLPGCGCRSC